MEFDTPIGDTLDFIKEVRNLRNALLTATTIWLAEQPDMEHEAMMERLTRAHFRVAVLYEMFEKASKGKIDANLGAD
jgi:hypothetical protein